MQKVKESECQLADTLDEALRNGVDLSIGQVYDLESGWLGLGGKALRGAQTSG